ncbi:hypothetical protein RJ55_08277 [Drechmeria coniospora]|nr:hypothetical protein RJ55_08277 [Drechmeria coniospora]
MSGSTVSTGAEGVQVHADGDVSRTQIRQQPEGLPGADSGECAVAVGKDDAVAEKPGTAGGATEEAAEAAEAPPMSKNALKRLRRQQAWEDGADERRKRRKEKRHDRKEKQREERAVLVAQGVDPRSLIPEKAASTVVPVTLIVDCDFEGYMTDKERISLSSQVTRCYSDNRNARYRSHLWVAGWGGKIEERFNTKLRRQQENWRGVGFVAGDFLACAAKARERMAKQGGQMIEALRRSVDEPLSWHRDEQDPFPLPQPAPALDDGFRDVVYLTSESPYTLQRLEPHTCYVVGGLVDKNREKGLCYRRACERGIRTARLPIGQFMVMQSRQVLATNHVVEIMLKWLEHEDWAVAFSAVIPKRKGGKLIGDGEVEVEADEGRADAAADGGEDVDDEGPGKETLDATETARVAEVAGDADARADGDGDGDAGHDE